MKKAALVMGTLSVVLFGSTVHAASYGQAGCGLGSMLFSSDNTWWKQVLAATTNGIFANQTFAISSGTSNCTNAGLVKIEKEQEAFAEVNYQDLKRDMASGGGEFLASFSSLLGCEDPARPALFRFVQLRYPDLVPSSETTPVQMLTALKQSMKAEPVLAASCSDERALARAQGKQVDVAAGAPTTVAK